MVEKLEGFSFEVEGEKWNCRGMGFQLEEINQPYPINTVGIAYADVWVESAQYKDEKFKKRGVLIGSGEMSLFIEESMLEELAMTLFSIRKAMEKADDLVKGMDDE